MNKENIPSPYREDLEVTKVVIFMETKSNSDEFEQIMFNEASMKRVLDAIEKEMPHPKPNVFVVTTKGETFKFPEIKSIFNEAEIQEARNKVV